VGDLETITCAAASKIERVKAPGLATVVQLTRGAEQRFDGALLRMRLKWGRTAMKRLGGSPVCVLPAQLPQPITPYGPVHLDASAVPDTPAELPRLSVDTPLEEHAGRVTDAAGRTLMLALPIGKRLAEHVWHADDTLVMGGPLLGTMHVSHRDLLRDLLLAMHRFFGEELGHAERLRALVVYDDDASNFTDIDHFSALDARPLMTTREGRISGERLMARDLVALWWSHGVRPVGRDGDILAAALTLYGSLRWFAATAPRAVLEAQRQFLHGIVSKIESMGAPVEHRQALASSRLALELHDTSTRGPALGHELRSLITSDWGRAIPVAMLEQRLVRAGVRLPNDDPVGSHNSG
jgi:hypothetical protein